MKKDDPDISYYNQVVFLSCLAENCKCFFNSNVSAYVTQFDALITQL